MAQHHTEIAAIALKRREDALPKDYLLPASVLENLPLNLTTVPRSSGHFTAEELEIIETVPEEILMFIRERKWTSLKVTKAFCKAATVAQQLTNCLTEILFPEALERAKFLDEFLEKTGEVLGPLHGLPISLKDCFNIPPHPSSIGMSCYANTPTLPSERTILVTILSNLGAVFYVKTTTPTAMMMMETVSVVWGETRNPWNSGTSAGGSSGGEGALIAMRGSCLGVGTDIGGSIRIPSAFNGLYGFKPSFGRFPTYATKSGISGQDFIFSNNGPMASSLPILQIYCSAVLSSSPSASPWSLDPKCLPLPWSPSPTISPPGRKLRIGIILDNDGEISVHPPILRALNMTREALEKEGHEIFEWKPIDHPEMVREMNASFHTLGAAAILDLTLKHGEPVYGSMKEYHDTYVQGEEGTLNPTKLREMIICRNGFQKAYLDRWTATASSNSGQVMDAIISPVSCWTAPRLGITQSLFNVNFSGVWNVLDYPACTFPVTSASALLDPKRPESWKPLSELDGKIQADYEPRFYEGTKVALQCVTRRLEDEKCLEVVGVISRALEGVGKE